MKKTLSFLLLTTVPTLASAEFYAGVQGTATRLRVTGTTDEEGLETVNISKNSSNLSFGVYGGYNHTFTEKIMAGIDLALDFPAHTKETFIVSKADGDPYDDGAHSVSYQRKFSVTPCVTLSYVQNKEWTFYVKAGPSISREGATLTKGSSNTKEVIKTKVRPYLGFGSTYNINKVGIKLEYAHIFGKKRIAVTNVAGAGGDNGNVYLKQSPGHNFKIGVHYRF